jgi:putative glutamine amidotransferase
VTTAVTIANLKPRDFNLSSTLTQGLPHSRSIRTPRTSAVVAVSATSDESNGNPHRVRLNNAYVEALESAGLVPVVVPPLTGNEAVHAILSRVDGLLLTGGEDVEPSLYGQPRSPKCGESNLARDRTEIALVQAAREMRLPVLAICRGPQLLNVALGGTLIQDIPSEVPNALGHNAREDRAARVHDVSLEKGSKLAKAIGETDITVNSLHHQSVLEVAPGLRVTGRAPDGIVEGLESSTDDWWVLAVQWHPEEMNDSPEPWDRGIFKAFADRLAEG